MPRSRPWTAGVVLRRQVRRWILRRGAQGGWDRRRVPNALAWVGQRWGGAAEGLQLAALMHLGAGRPAEAVALFEAAIARGLGGWASVRHDLGMALMACGELARAEVEFREACRLTGDAYWAQHGLSECRMMQRLADDVGACIDNTERAEADEAGPGQVFREALRRVIPVLPRKRVEALRDLVVRRPDAAEAARFLAHIEAERGNVPLAVRLLRQTAPKDWLAGSVGTLPHFLIIGQAKAGTTALLKYLSAHPQVVGPLIKEPHFWSLHHRFGMDWYRAFFPPLPPGAGLITGEASPTYLVAADAPQRIAKHLPSARLIVLLRDPVPRAYSHFRMDETSGLANTDFDVAITREMDAMPVCPTEPGEFQRGYLAESAALPHLKRWLRYVSAERLLILQNRDLATDLPGVMRRVCRHLGIAPFVPPDAQRHNEGTYPPMPAALEQRLRAWFAEHDRALADFLAALPPATRGIAT